MRPMTREEEQATEDESARRSLGSRGVLGGPAYAKMTPQRAFSPGAAIYAALEKVGFQYHSLRQRY